MIATVLATLALTLTPAEAVRAAAADNSTLDPQWRGQMRYLVCDNNDQRIAVTYLLNAVSRSRLVALPKDLGNGLLRIDLAEYINPREPKTYQELTTAWEKLSFDDPYFHVKTQVSVVTKVPSPKATPSTLSLDGGWTDLKAATSLRTTTGSAGAVLRADYFVAKVAAENYYAWAGTPSLQADFFASVGVDKAVVEKLAADSAANLFRSNITHKPRRVLRLPGPQGSIWFTLDVDGESPDRDPVRNPVDVVGPVGTQRFNFQASEIFYTRANGFWGVALYAANGQRQDTVPDKIAKDVESIDGIVQPIISCIRCHETHGKAGLQSFVDDETPLLTGESAVLKSYLPEVATRIGELYNPTKLNRELERDREDYTTAVASLGNSLSTKEAALALVHTYANYTYEPVNLITAAHEAGVTEAVFVTSTVNSTDPITLTLRAGKQVNRKAFEASFQDIMVRISK